MKRFVALVFLLACGDDSAPGMDAAMGMDAAVDVMIDASAPLDAGADSEVAECRVDVDCDDDDECTNDTCSAGTCTHVADPLCCTTDDECVDADPCTNEERCVANRCERSEAMGCMGCIDRDRDGHFWNACGGDDCNDENALIHPGAEPICLDADFIDADCNGVFDVMQPECGSTSPTCESATLLPLGAEVEFLTGSDGMCGSDTGEFFRFDLTETSDVSVTVRILYDEEVDPMMIDDQGYAAYLRADCADTANAFPGQVCDGWSPSSPFWPGSPTRTYDAAHMAAGSYILEIQGSVFGPDLPVMGLAVVVEATASMTPECTSGTRLGSSATGSTDGSDAFRFTCEHFLRGAPKFVSADERVHPFTVTERERLRITGRSATTGLRLALHTDCDPALQPTQCVEATSCDERTLDAILDPGEYFLVVEGGFGGDHDYELDVHREAPGESCAGARVVTTSGIVRGDTTGAGDDFRASEPCRDARGPDHVFRIDVTTPGYFSADILFDETFDGAYLTFRDECGGEPIRQHNAGVGWSVEPGTYYLTIDGMDTGDFGAYSLDITVP